ncbi:hypothetical protein [Haloferula helveola]
MNPFRSALGGCLLVAAIVLPASAQKLQIINASQEPAEVFWLSEDEKVPQGTVAPGDNTIINTTIGHRFLVVGQESGTESTVTSKVLVQGFYFDPKGNDGIPAFYTQREYAQGFPIVASKTVNPYALKEAAYLADLMMAKRPDVREAMIKSGARLCIIAWNEFTTDLPEFSHFAPKDYWDARARGTGGSATDPYCSCGEENLLGYPGDPYSTENILIHEFAHNIHLRGLANVDPAFDDRVKAAYEDAMAKGLWKGKYASVNHYEYFAEGVQSWFDDNRENDHDHNHVNTRKELLEYDPGLAELCREVFRDTEFKYTKPATRLTGHLEGYDPSKAPTFVWPERLKKAKEEISEQVAKRNKEAKAEDRKIRGWQVHIDPVLLNDKNLKATEHALELMEAQLDEILEVVPKPAVAELRKVPLYFNPPYEKGKHGAEYHPGAQWLKDNGRDPKMAKGVEFTNTEVFEEDTRRMPNFTLHELAHAYHDRFLPEGFENPDLKKAYERAKDSGTYDKVERRDSEGRTRMDKAYAMTDPMEYFAESTEAYFSTNDFFPYTREELLKHDPEMHDLVKRLWGH